MTTNVDVFKLDVRKLKALGLTEGLEVGYQLSPRGVALLAAARADRGASALESARGGVVASPLEPRGVPAPTPAPRGWCEAARAPCSNASGLPYVERWRSTCVSKRSGRAGLEARRARVRVRVRVRVRGRAHVRCAGRRRQARQRQLELDADQLGIVGNT